MLNTKISPLKRGNQAETEALGYLQNFGLVVVERNYRCRRGEIDLIMDDGETLVFVEVRYRNNSRYGSAMESVDVYKQSRLIACASHYLASKDINKPARFDVVAMTHEKGEPRIQWMKDAFQS